MKQKKKHIFDVQFITASISTSLVLLLIGAVTLIMLTANSLSVYVRENLALSLLLHDGTTNSESESLLKKIHQMPSTLEARYISKDEVLAEETAAMGINPSEFLGFNPYSSSIEVRLKADYANSDSIAIMEKMLRGNSCISEISYPHELVDKINDNIRKIGLLLLILALALGLISFALINNTIKLTIYSQRFLLHTMKLVGADWKFIRRPFMARNFWVGFIASLLAIVLLGTGLWVLYSREPELMHIISHPMLLGIAGGIIVFGILITMLCARISLNRFLRMKASDLYYI